MDFLSGIQFLSFFYKNYFLSINNRVSFLDVRLRITHRGQRMKSLTDFVSCISLTRSIASSHRHRHRRRRHHRHLHHQLKHRQRNHLQKIHVNVFKLSSNLAKNSRFSRTSLTRRLKLWRPDICFNAFHEEFRETFILHQNFFQNSILKRIWVKNAVEFHLYLMKQKNPKILS